MDNAIKVGNEVSKESAENLKDLIENIFRVGFETRMDQETVRKALDVIEKVSEIRNVTITNSTFSGDKVVNMDESKANL